MRLDYPAKQVSVLGYPVDNDCKKRSHTWPAEVLSLGCTAIRAQLTLQRADTSAACLASHRKRVQNAGYGVARCGSAQPGHKRSDFDPQEKCFRGSFGVKTVLRSVVEGMRTSEGEVCLAGFVDDSKRGVGMLMQSATGKRVCVSGER